MSHEQVARKLTPRPAPVRTEQHSYMGGTWVFTASKGQILSTQCTCSSSGSSNGTAEGPANGNASPGNPTPPSPPVQPQPKCSCGSDAHGCAFCVYSHALTNLPHWPEMVFAHNTLTLQHQGGVTMNFNALDALRGVGSDSDWMRVAASEEWQAARQDSLKSCAGNKGVKKFDWTYRTEYMGTYPEEMVRFLFVIKYSVSFRITPSFRFVSFFIFSSVTTAVFCPHFAVSVPVACRMWKFKMVFSPSAVFFFISENRADSGSNRFGAVEATRSDQVLSATAFVRGRVS